MIFAWIIEDVSREPLPVQFFYGIYRLITSLINFLVSLVEGFCLMLNNLGSGKDFLSDFLSWLPPEVYAVVLSIFTIVIIYKVIGREG